MSRISVINPKYEAPFTAEQALNMEAYLVISSESIQYAAKGADGETSIYIATADISSRVEGGLQQLFWDHPLFSLPYKSTEISIEDGSPFVVVPQDLVDSASPEEWLSVSTDIERRKVLSTPLDEERASFIYSISQELFDFSQRSFSIPSYSHSITPLIRMAVRQTRRDTPRLIVLHHLGDYIHLVVASEGELLLANRYRVASDTDTLYYLTALYRQYKFNPQDTPLYVFSGEDRSMLIELLRESIGEVKVNDYPSLNSEYDAEKNHKILHPHLVFQLLCV